MKQNRHGIKACYRIHEQSLASGHRYPESYFRGFEKSIAQMNKGWRRALLSHIRDGPSTHVADLCIGQPHILYLQFKPKARAKRAGLGS